MSLLLKGSPTRIPLMRYAIARRFLMQFKEEPRINQVGIQYVSEGIHKKLFPKHDSKAYLTPEHPELIDIAKFHLKQNNLLGKKTQITEPIEISNFPDLIGKSSMDEHFHKLGTAASEPYLSMANKFLGEKSELPPMIPVSDWVFQAGWTRYEHGKKPRKVDYPLEDSLVFDVEVLYKRSKYAVLATCASTKAWYGWVSPFLVNFAKDPTFDDFKYLIPFNSLQKEKLLVGYYVSFDRARVLDEYNIKQSKAFYLDGMSLHVAAAGICSQQRISWQNHKKVKNELEDMENSESATDFASEYDIAQEVTKQLVDDPWLNKGTLNSLKNVAEFHCGIKLDKTDRDFFGELDPQPILDNFNRLMEYCAKDVHATFEVTKKLFPEFRRKVPHPVSFAAMKNMGSLILPTTTKWESYLEKAEAVYQKNRSQVTQNLKDRAEDLLKFIELSDESLKPDTENDPWLSQLNWDLKEARFKKNGDPTAKQAYLTGYPEWYRELCKTQTVLEDGSKIREMNISLRTRITPLLLKIKWEGYPIFWTDSEGWCFMVPFNEGVFEDLASRFYKIAKLSEEDLQKHMPVLRDSTGSYELFKIPHPEGSSKRCTSIFSKNYSRFFENGTLTSEYHYVEEILSLNNAASYWMGNRKRIMDQFVVYADPSHERNDFFKADEKEAARNKEMGIIIPQLVSMGTITRRATENTWLTASNAKKDRIGSELKAMIEAPEGYVFVGADVDSEELWIASLVGDALFKTHGATALGWMTLEGEKNEGTDLHSRTAEIMGISRGDAKIFNYGRIYGAGVKFATRLLKQFNASLSDEQANKIAVNLYAKTKGKLSKSRSWDRKIYHGGSESIMFNSLESIAYQNDPRTPVLGAAITDALTIANLNKNEYLTSRVNWAIQSSGVDYLHLLVVSMDYLIKRYNVDARLAITVHDELRYLVKEEDKYKVGLLLQISNVWTRAMFCEQLGILELPQSCAFFSEVDIDKVLRKEIDLDCITPSHPEAIAAGEALDIHELLEKVEHGEILSELDGGSDVATKGMSKLKYKSRKPALARIGEGLSVASIIARARLECSGSPEEWRTNNAEFCKTMHQVKIDRAMLGEYYESTQVRSRSNSDGQAKSYPKPRSRLKKEVEIGSDGTKELESQFGKKVKAKEMVKSKKESVAKMKDSKTKLETKKQSKKEISVVKKVTTTSKKKKSLDAAAKPKVEPALFVEGEEILSRTELPEVNSLSSEGIPISTGIRSEEMDTEEEAPSFRPFHAIPNGRVIRSGYVRREDFQPSSRS